MSQLQTLQVRSLSMHSLLSSFSSLLWYVSKLNRNLQTEFVAKSEKVLYAHALWFSDPVLNRLFCDVKLRRKLRCLLAALRLPTGKHSANEIHSSLGNALCKIRFWHSLTLLSVANKASKNFYFLNFHFDYAKIFLTQIGQERWNRK